MCLSSIAFPLENGRPCVSPLLPSQEATRLVENGWPCVSPATFHGELYKAPWRTDGHVESPRCYLPREATRPVENGRPCVSPLLASTGRYTARWRTDGHVSPRCYLHGKLQGSWRTDGPVSPRLTSTGSRTAMCLPVVSFHGKLQGSWRTDGHVSPRCYLPREDTRLVENGRPCVSPFLPSTTSYTARGERTAM